MPAEITERKLRGLAALADSEAADSFLHAIERLGLLLSDKAKTLGGYYPCFQDFVSSNLGQLPTDFEQLYRHVQQARNDAQHHGAFARHLVSHATRLALHLEDALLSKEMNFIGDYAITNPVCAEFWHPIAFCRQQMLENSFSALPIFDEGKLRGMVMDAAIAGYLRGQLPPVGQRNGEFRNVLLGQSLQTASKGEGTAKLEIVELRYLITVSRDTLVPDCLQKFATAPMIFVMEPGTPERLFGIVTAFDVL